MSVKIIISDSTSWAGPRGPWPRSENAAPLCHQLQLLTLPLAVSSVVKCWTWKQGLAKFHGRANWQRIIIPRNFLNLMMATEEEIARSCLKEEVD